MQLKLGAGFLAVALLYTIVGLVVPRLGLGGFSETLLTTSSYVVIGLSAAWLLSRVFGNRMRELAHVAGEISRGDLSRHIDTDGSDETAELARSLASMTDSLLNVVLEVQTTAERISSSAQSLSSVSDAMNVNTEEIAGTARDMARGAEEQAAQVVRTSEITRDLGEIVESVTSRAKDVHHSAASAAERAAGGADEAKTAARALLQLSERTSATSAAVDGFRQKAQDIGNIVSTITAISHQTHLLSINASIEAARAGEEGRGFGVVAEEVSRLADNVRRLSERVSSLSDEILDGSRALAGEIRGNLDSTGQARELVERSSTSFEGILDAIRGTASRAGEITQLTARQKVATAEVAGSLDEISAIAGRNAAGTEEASGATYEQTVAMHKMAESAHALARTSMQLRDLVAVFKIR